MPNFVQEYRSTDVGMPVLTGVAASLTALLDAVLVNGGTSMPVTSIVESGTTYTATIPADVTLENLDHLTLAGITGAGAVLNVDQTITFIDSTHFSFQGPGSLGAITGTITYKRSPLGWTRPFSVSGISVYLPQSGLGFPQFPLRVDDSNTIGTAGGAKESAIRGYESMSDVNTGINPIPTVAQAATGLCWRKSLTADATARPWFAIGDGATFYFIPNCDASFTTGRGLFGWGGFLSNKPGDAYNCLISGWASFNLANVSVSNNGLSGTYHMVNATPQAGLFVARSYSQAGGSLSISHVHRWINSGSVTNTALGAANSILSTPHAVDASYWFDATDLRESAGVIRGRPRGIYAHCHNAAPFASEFDITTGVAGLPGITLLNVWTCATGAGGSVAFDRYGPW